MEGRRDESARAAGITNDGLAIRKRGLKKIALAILLLVLALGLMIATQPARGPYAGWVQIVVHAGWLAAVVVFAVGLFHAVVGAPGVGLLRGVRTLIGVVLGVGTTLVAAVGGFVLNSALTWDGDRSHDASDDVDFDWD